MACYSIKSKACNSPSLLPLVSNFSSAVTNLERRKQAYKIRLLTQGHTAGKRAALCYLHCQDRRAVTQSSWSTPRLRPLTEQQNQALSNPCLR